MSKNFESMISPPVSLGERKLHLTDLVKIIKGNYKILTPVEIASIKVINLEIQRIESHIDRRK